MCFFEENGSINQHLEKGQVICIYFLFDGSFKFKLDVLVIFTSHQETFDVIRCVGGLFSHVLMSLCYDEAGNLETAQRGPIKRGPYPPEV